jgi:PAS domain S-box-containing protein
MPYGVVGGKLLGGFEHGRYAAGMGLRILNGVAVSQIPVVTESPTRYVFNYPQLERWNIAPAALPADSLILAKPVSTYEKYKYYIWGVLVFITLLLGTITVLVVNVSRRISAEKELARREKQLRNISENVPVMIAQLDSDLRYKFVNQAYADRFGMATTDLLGRKAEEVLGEELFNEVESHMLRALAGHYESYDVALPFSAGDTRQHIHVSIAPERDEVGQVDGFIAAITDITERKQAEQKQAFLQQRLEALWAISKLQDADLKTICDTILDENTGMTDSAYGFYGFMDEREENLTIYSWSENTMKDCEVHDKPLVYPIAQAGVWGNAVRERQPFLLNDYQENCANKKGLPEGHVALQRVLAVPVFKEDKIVAVGAVANKPGNYTYQDVTQLETFLSNVQILIDKKEAEEQRIKLEQQLAQAQKMETVGRLAGGIAHNFNNYLAVILGNLQLAKYAELSRDDLFELLESAHSAAQGSASLVRQIMAFSRQEATRLEPVGLQSIIEETVSMLRSTMPSSVSLSLQLPAAAEEITIKADSKRLQEAIINLCSNAIDSMPGKGMLRLALETVELRGTDIPATCEAAAGRFARITLEDDGSGMSEEVLEKIFDPFFTTKDAGQGTGIGLASVQATISQYQGFINVQSELGRGTTFTIFLPVSSGKRSPRQSESGETIVPGGAEHILFVDDERELAKTAERILKTLGYRVTVETDSEQALRSFRQSPDDFDLLLTDLTMPGLTGLELIEAVQKLRPELPVILCTGNTSHVTQEDIGKHQINSVCLKPLDLADLSQKLKTALSRKKGE